MSFCSTSRSVSAESLKCKSSLLSQASIVGSVVECSPATRAARVRFPDDAEKKLFFNQTKNSFARRRIFLYSAIHPPQKILAEISS